MKPIVLKGAAGVLVFYLAAAFLVPRTVPRLSVLPAPAAYEYDDGCNRHAVTWYRSRPFWARRDVSHLLACPE